MKRVVPEDLVGWQLSRALPVNQLAAPLGAKQHHAVVSTASREIRVV